MNKIQNNHTVLKKLEKIVNNIFSANILGKSRKRENVDARRAFCNILKIEGFTCTSLSKYLKKEHSSILHYGRDIESIIITDPIFSKKYNKCLEVFKKYLEYEFYSNERDLLKEIKYLEKDVVNLKKNLSDVTKEKDFLKQESRRLYKESKRYNTKNNNIYDIITLRTKPGTEDHIERKINTFFNGVYSEKIKVF